MMVWIEEFSSRTGSLFECTGGRDKIGGMSGGVLMEGEGLEEKEIVSVAVSCGLFGWSRTRVIRLNGCSLGSDNEWLNY